tara:strand:- start:634 stop:885 length:252 start_codon:yes stop_codon:yes gene_type:complete
MTKVTVDNVEYDTDDMKEETRAKLLSLQYVAAELRKLEMTKAALQTASNTYARALKLDLEGQAVDQGDDDIEIQGLGENISFD